MLSDRPLDNLSNVLHGKHKDMVNTQIVYIFTPYDLLKSPSKAYSLHKFKNLRSQYGPVCSLYPIHNPIF